MDFFKLELNQTTVGREITAGVVTFMAMALILGGGFYYLLKRITGAASALLLGGGSV